MGLDTVELVIRFEDAFGIPITDEVATEMTTPRKVTEYLLSQLKQGEESACMSQQAFYRLRKDFVPALGIQRSAFHPALELAHVIPLKGRIATWTSLRSQIGVSALPTLGRPRWVISLLSLLALATAIVVFDYLHLATGSLNVAFWVSVLMLVALGFAGARVTRPLKREFRGRYQTAGDVAKYVAKYSPHTFKQEWTREEVAQLVREIIIEETGFHEFTEDSRFIEDMHLD